MDSEATQQPSGSIAFLAWIEVNKQRLMIGGVVVLVVVLGGALFLQQQAQKERAASRAFSEVKLAFNPAMPAAPGTADALLKVANDYRGTKAAARALLTSGGILFSEKKYSEAEARFSQVLSDYPDSAWSAEALLGVAASLDAQGKTTEAITKYEDLRRRFSSSPVIDDAKLALARLYETDKPEDAFKLYDELTKIGQGSGIAMEASMRQDDLLKARPELARLKETLIPPTPTSIPLTQFSNQVRAAVSNVPAMAVTNAPSSTSQPVQIKLNPSPAPSPGK